MWTRLFTPIDIASLVYFRIIFGIIMLIQVFGFIGIGWKCSYCSPFIGFRFPYYGFDWLKLFPGDLILLPVIALVVTSIFVILGFKYRASTILLFLFFSYWFLLDESHYQNHLYLMLLISFLMIFIPANRAFSLDARRNLEIRTDATPALSLWLLRAQVGIVYVFGGIAKLNYDWVFRQEPIRMLLKSNTDFPLIGSFFTEEWMVYLFNYSALLLDLFVVPFLLWKRTRYYAIGLAISFHLLNSHLFGNIGVFPWFMIFATLLFLSPEWPRRTLSYIRKINFSPKINKKDIHPTSLTSRQRTILVLFVIFLIVQIAVPFRHYLYPGDVAYTMEGHKFAWRMKLIQKTASLEFHVTNPVTNKTVIANPDDLSKFEYNIMKDRPDLILVYAHHLADAFRQAGLEVEVYVKSEVALNGRESQVLIDPTVNLAAEQRSLLPKMWIMQNQG